MTHATRTGLASFLVDAEPSCFDEVRYLLSFLPSNNHQDPPYFAPSDQPSRRCDELLDIVPVEPNRAYDIRDVIAVIVDDGDYLEVQALGATNIVCAFARRNGHVVGMVANQPAVLADALNIDAAEKAARFVRTCDSFNISLVAYLPEANPRKLTHARGVESCVSSAENHWPDKVSGQCRRGAFSQIHLRARRSAWPFVAASGVPCGAGLSCR